MQSKKLLDSLSVKTVLLLDIEFLAPLAKKQEIRGAGCETCCDMDCNALTESAPSHVDHKPHMADLCNLPVYTVVSDALGDFH